MRVSWHYDRLQDGCRVRSRILANYGAGGFPWDVAKPSVSRIRSASLGEILAEILGRQGTNYSDHFGPPPLAEGAEQRLVKRAFLGCHPQTIYDAKDYCSTRFTKRFEPLGLPSKHSDSPVSPPVCSVPEEYNRGLGRLCDCPNLVSIHRRHCARIGAVTSLTFLSQTSDGRRSWDW